MKKLFSLILCLLLIFSAMPVHAVDDASGLNYKLSLKLYDSSGKAITSFQKDDTFTAKLTMANLGSVNPPMYGMQGKLDYNKSLLQYVASTPNKGVEVTKQSDGTLAFAFLDRTGRGTAIGKVYEIGTFTFKAINGGSDSLKVYDFALTNKDASLRNAQSGTAVEFSVVDGETVPQKYTLYGTIIKAQEEIDNAVISDSAVSLVYPEYRVTNAVADALRSAISSANAVYYNTLSSIASIEKAISDLNYAIDQFSANKHYGTKPSGGSVKDSRKGKSWNQFVTVNVTAGPNGAIAQSSKVIKVLKGTSVTIESIPDKGYEVEFVYVNGEKFNGALKFTIPSVTNDTEVKVTFRKIETVQKPSGGEKAFSDVGKTSWYYDSVQYVVSKGLFNGTGKTAFSPDMPMTRAMMVSVLYRLSEDNFSANESPFADVVAGQWYSEAVSWANGKKLVTGYSSNKYGPNDPITREQMVTILYRYSIYKGYDVSVSGETISKFKDEASVGNYAVDAMKWAIDRELLKGTGENLLLPKGKATRAQVATILMRYIENITKTKAN